jgi:hypothetical protein
MLAAMAGIRAAGGTVFSLETLFKGAQSEEKEAWRIFTMDGLVTSVATDALPLYSSITDAEGFTVVSRHGGESSSPPKQRPQCRCPPRPSNEAARVNLFNEQCMTSFCMPGGPSLDSDITADFVTKQINNEQHFYPTSSIVSLSLTPPSVGAGSNLDTYISNPTPRQPSKKSYEGANAASTVTAAFSTSSAASPT